MVFNSFPFIFFFVPIVVAGFYFLARKDHGWAITWLVLASLCFYGLWDYRYLPILLSSIVINYSACRWLLAAGRAKHPWRLAISISFNLILLCFFKYVNFFIGSINGVSGTALPSLDIILPIGISFFTFTQIAVLVDAYHGKIKEMRFSHYCLFASYFPYIVAGPILRQQEMLPQFAAMGEGEQQNNCRPGAGNFAVGISIFIFGLGKKLLIADNLGAAMNPVFAGDSPQFFQAWLGMLAYTFQLYFDFSGYSDMAIGVSRLLGFKIPINFNSPYKATSISDFWQRWHISLSQFLKNYLYIPLGGNRSGQLMRYRNLILTMLLGGLWHGANWTFVIWGGLHGLYLCVQHGWQFLRKSRGEHKIPSAAHRAANRLLTWALTFLAVLVAWCFFRAPDVASALAVLAGMAGLHGISPVTEIDSLAYIMLFFSAVAAFWLPNTNELFLSSGSRDDASSRPLSLFRANWSPTLRWGLAVGLVFALCLLSIEQTNEFIYAQF
ncbi:MAG: hypothetical protein ACD_75C02615G0003 [uncultured bacterium]|nr:MAG: hypothetical protein ACD_75C02615G0003 [uncultured bacterium]